MELLKATSVNSRAEELFVQLFCEAFGPEKTENLQVQYPCVDIYGRHRYIDFALESPESKIAIEIDGETYHNPSKVSENKYADDLLKQNSLIYDNWKVYRWIYSQLEKQPEKVKDELITFLGTSPMFKAFEADLPVQMEQTIELRDYQQEASAHFVPPGISSGLPCLSDVSLGVSLETSMALSICSSRGLPSAPRRP